MKITDEVTNPLVCKNMTITDALTMVVASMPQHHSSWVIEAVKPARNKDGSITIDVEYMDKNIGVAHIVFYDDKVTLEDNKNYGPLINKATLERSYWKFMLNVKRSLKSEAGWIAKEESGEQLVRIDRKPETSAGVPREDEIVPPQKPEVKQTTQATKKR